MKVLAMWMVLLAIPPLSAQDFESKRLTRLPWNADWMEQAKDTMVHGENYHGYPGPLPKMYAALGQDPSHPGVDFELEVIVNRDALFWEGNCNGWASAAVQFDEPGPMVVNGVKLFRGEAKAILSAIWKDHVLVRVSEREAAGMKASSFHKILQDFTDANRPIIFDVTIGTESWNYPVAGYERTLYQSDDWVDVDITVLYSSTLDILSSDQDFGEVVFRELSYTYRYSKTEPVVYEWTGASVNNRPHHAWYPTLPYNSLSWSVYGNHYFDMATWETLNELAASEDAARDLYEPNNDPQSAPLLASNLVLASLHDDQPDWFQVEVAVGEPLSFDMEVYDGPAVNVALMKDDVVVAQWDDLSQNTTITVPSEEAGTYFLRITLPPGTGEQFQEVSFYRILQGEHRAWYRAPDFGSVLAQTKISFINHDDNLNVVSGSETTFVEGKGARTFDLHSGDFLRTNDRGLWAVEGSSQDRMWKRYYREHPHQLPYNIPHLTFRNGWSTRIEVVALNPDTQVSLDVYATDGQLLQSAPLDKDMLAGTVPLHAILTGLSRESGAWFRLQTAPDNLLTGAVYFEHSSGITTHYDVESTPSSGEVVVYDLRPPSKGWTGLSLLNVSGVSNEINYRLYDEKGRELDEGLFVLEPGQRLLGTPESLTGMDVEEGYSLHFYSVYNMESLALQCYSEEGFIFTHRLPTVVLDHLKETYVSVSSDVDAQTLVVANQDNTTNWILIEGYSADGRLQGETRLYGRALKSWEVARASLSELLLNDDFSNADAPIAYFKVRAQRPAYMHELVGHPDSPSKTYVKSMRIYDDP